LFWFRWRRVECQEEKAVVEQILSLAQRQHDPALLLGAYYMMGCCWLQGGAVAPARIHLEQGLALSTPQGDATPHITPGGNRHDGVSCRVMMALVLWMLGYPDQAVQRSQEALTLAHALAHPYSLAYTLFVSAVLRRYRREWQMAQAHTEAALALATEHGFARYVALGAVIQGAVRAMKALRGESMALV